LETAGATSALKLRSTRLRTLLLVSGVFSLILLVFAEEVGQISGSGLLEAALTTGFAFSLVAFVLIGSVGLGKKGLRDIRKVINQRVVKCPICNEPLPEAPLRQARRLHSFHYQTVHPDAWSWDQKWRRKLFLGTIVLCILLAVSGAYMVLTGNHLGFALIALPIITVLTFTSLLSLKLRQFRKEWTSKEREVRRSQVGGAHLHARPSEQTTTSL